MAKPKRKYRWRGVWFLAGLVFYWMIAFGNAGCAQVVSESPTSVEAGATILTTLGFVMVLMFAGVKGWGFWTRLGYLGLTWIGTMVMALPGAFVWFFLLGDRFLDGGALLIGGTPLVLFAMRRCRWFTKEIVPVGDSEPPERLSSLLEERE